LSKRHSDFLKQNSAPGQWTLVTDAAAAAVDQLKKLMGKVQSEITEMANVLGIADQSDLINLLSAQDRLYRAIVCLDEPNRSEPTETDQIKNLIDKLGELRKKVISIETRLSPGRTSTRT
jgi:hypothetical protein